MSGETVTTSNLPVTIDIEKLETEAKAQSAKHVANMLQRTDQLEKVDQYIKRVSRKKVSVDTMLKTAMQSQLDGVRTGLNQLQTALNDIQDVKNSLGEISSVLDQLPTLIKHLSSVRDENTRHSQLSTAMENLKHIFNVPENVDKTQQWINKGQLLYAHQSLADLEASRDDLLFELHKLPYQSSDDQSMLKAYFAEVTVLSENLEKQLWLLLSRALNSIRKQPTVVVTVLRIIEREERTDAFTLQRERQNGFLSPGRPKCWKEKALEVLENSVAQRIEGNQFEEREDNKMWLVRHLEVTRQIILEDLRVVKTLAVSCFPAHWNIMEKYVEMYHRCLSKHLESAVYSGIEGNEIVSLLSWVLNTYPGDELLQHPELQINPQPLPLLSADTVKVLADKYLKSMEQNYNDWMAKTVHQEVEEWMANLMPEADSAGQYQTAAPVIVFQMIDENLQVALIISTDVSHKALLLSMDMLVEYGKKFRDAIVDFKNKHFEDRSRITFFTQDMMAIANNCSYFIELAQHLKQKYWKPGLHENEAGQKFEKIFQTYEGLRDLASTFLLEEVFLDLEPHFIALISRPWLTSNIPVDTICVTLDDYFQDYIHLKPKNLELVAKKSQTWVARKYILAVLQKKMSFKSPEERRDAANKIIREADQIKKLFIKIAQTVGSYDSPFDSIHALAEVLKVTDPELVPLELHGLVKKYPDVTRDQIICLLALRGDIGKLDMRQRATEIIADHAVQTTPIPQSIFSQIPVQASLFL